MHLLALLLALSALAFLARSLCRGLAVLGPAPLGTLKSAVISTVTGITADTTSSPAYELPRGAEDVAFDFTVSLNTGFSAGTNYVKGYILGCDRPGELTVAGETIPSASNGPGVRLPRFLKVEWDETGTIDAFTAECRIRYNLPGGAGRQYEADYRGG